jgi:ArsR family transcriptional regulator, arsenate/arsenite/antimonite-responsive transcriptional repressor
MARESTPSFEIHKALGDATRFRIFLALAQNRDWLCVNAIAARLKLSQPTVSQHLKVLKAAGIAQSARLGHRIHYGIDRDLVRAVMQRMIGLVQKPETAPRDTSEK